MWRGVAWRNAWLFEKGKCRGRRNYIQQKLFVVRSSDIVYQDDLVTAFRDISPQAPTHILIIPNILIPTVNDVSAEHEQALGRMITVAAKIAEQEGIAEDGYRLIMNTNRHGGQEVYHIHMHLLGGRPLGPMLAHKGL